MEKIEPIDLEVSDNLKNYLEMQEILYEEMKHKLLLTEDDVIT